MTIHDLDISDKNEMTASPYWLILDPRQNMCCDIHDLSHQITGPFFSREEAQQVLLSRRHHYSTRAAVYGMSGCYSIQYDRKYREQERVAREKAKDCCASCGVTTRRDPDNGQYLGPCVRCRNNPDWGLSEYDNHWIPAAVQEVKNCATCGITARTERGTTMQTVPLEALGPHVVGVCLVFDDYQAAYDYNHKIPIEVRADGVL